MALIFIDSFDHYGTSDIGLKWSAVIPAGYSGSSTVINATAGRRGGGALVQAANNGVRKDLAGTQTLIVGYAMKYANAPTSNVPGSAGYWMTIGNGDGTHLYFAVGPDGSIMVHAHTVNSGWVVLGYTTAAVLQPNVYAYIEVKATISTGTSGVVKVLVNGINVLNLQNIRTANYLSTTELATRFSLYAMTTLGADLIYFDDLYVCDNTGATNNDFFGDVRIDVVRPNGEGSHLDFTPDTGTTHYSRVNEAVADQLSYVSSNVVGAKDSYQFTDLSTIVGVVHGVQIVDAATKDDAGVRSIAHLVKSGASEQYSASMPLSTDRKLYTTIHETDPATGTNWTQAGINGAEFGITVTA